MLGAMNRGNVTPVVLLLVVGLVAGCGGGGGGNGGGGGGGGNGGGGGSDIPVAGVVWQSRLAGTPMPNATVSAYTWPDVATVVTTSSPTGSDGRYSLKLPSSTAGKDVILVATAPTRLRASVLVAAIPASGRTNADIDIATTLAAELAAWSGKNMGVTKFSDSSVQTIASRFRQWEGTVNLQPVSPGGTDLPDRFGDGLKPGSQSNNYATADPVIKNALAHLQENADTQTLAAKRIVHWLRDIAFGLLDDGYNENNALRDALDEQRQVINDEVKISSALVQRLRWVTTMRIQGLTPGTYTWKQNAYGDKYLEYTGSAADGKSWVITSLVSDASLHDQITITPANKLDVFRFTPDAGSYTVRLIDTTETDANRTLDWTITLTFTGPTTAPTSCAVNLSAKDPGLTGPVSVTGTLSGAIFAPASDPNHPPAYSQLTLTGNINAPFFVGSVGNLTATWYESTNNANNLKSIAISDMRFTDNLSKPITGSLASALISFAPIASANQQPQFALPNDMKISGSQLTFSDHTFTITSGEVSFANTVHPDGTVTVNPTKLDGNITFKSSALTLDGTATSNWTTLPVKDSGLRPVPVSEYPVGSMTIKGDLQPSTGLIGTLDSTLVFATSNTAGTATLTINSLGYEGETLSGTIVHWTPVINGYLSKPTTVTMNLNEAPSGLKVHIASDSTGATSGWISTSDTNRRLADIGKAADLGLSELGADTLIIKYSDGTFETAASILPKPIKF